LDERRKFAQAETMTKSDLRTTLLAQRQALDPQQWADRSTQICQQLSQLELVRSAHQVLSYRSIRREPDLTGLASMGISASWGLPRCRGTELIWHRWQPDRDRLSIGAFGIKEPAEDWPLIGPEPGTVLLVPGLACDRRGYRLGYGGGFYDRLLAQPAWAQLIKIGIVFEFGIVDQLPIEPWDMPLDLICSEAGVVDVRSAH
jgi:5-formyltetrahydrofolate cyclo-ligase